MFVPATPQASGPSVADVEAFINRCLARKLSSEQIVRLFLKAGWNQRLVEHVIKAKVAEITRERQRIEHVLGTHHERRYP